MEFPKSNSEFKGVKLMNKVFNKVKAAIAAGSALAFSAMPAFAAECPKGKICSPLGTIDEPAVFFGNIINGLTVIAGTIALVYLVIGGIRYIMSGGDKVGVEAAREQITAAIVGLVIVFGAWFLITVVGRILGFDVLNLTPTPRK